MSSVSEKKCFIPVLSYKFSIYICAERKLLSTRIYKLKKYIFAKISSKENCFLCLNLFISIFANIIIVNIKALVGNYVWDENPRNGYTVYLIIK